MERSIALFGRKSVVIEQIYRLAADSAQEGGIGPEALAIPAAVVQCAIAFVRVLPDGLALPELSPEPNGSLSFDWIAARTRIVSVSVGATNRLAYAWIDGTDRGHGVARFDGITMPVLVLALTNLRSDEDVNADPTGPSALRGYDADQ
jgi:hypothetical protein